MSNRINVILFYTTIEFERCIALLVLMASKHLKLTADEVMILTDVYE
jgi:hypothetical protein